MKTDFCVRLKELRTENLMKQADLAAELNVSPRTVSSWEIGYREPSMEFIIAIADFFDVTLDYLCGREFI